MKTQTNSQVHSFNAKIIVALILALVLSMATVSCGTQRMGCPSVKGMSGYHNK